MNRALNKKAQSAPLATIILLMVFVINWFIWLGALINTMGQNMVETNNVTGVEAFFYSNLNIFIFIGLILGTMAYLYYQQ